MVADTFRWISVCSGLVLALLSGAAASFIHGPWHQRGRFLVFGALGGIVASTALGAIGRPMRWEVPFITVMVLVGIVCTVPVVLVGVRALRRGRG